MSTTKDGGQAFPRAGAHIRTLTGEMYDKGDVGMTLRDYFAAKAMQTFCVNDAWSYNGIAQAAYELADAMLAAREAQP